MPTGTREIIQEHIIGRKAKKKKKKQIVVDWMVFDMNLLRNIPTINPLKII